MIVAVVPVMAAPEPEPEAPSEPSDFDPEMVARKLPRTRILLVEDVAANQVVAATMLRRAGRQARLFRGFIRFI